MAMSGRTSSATLGALLILAVCFASTTDALVIVNTGASLITVFATPVCKPCFCPPIECLVAPCPEPRCLCPELCIVVPGVEVQVGASVTLNVAVNLFPLTFLTVEVKGVAYNVLAVDLKLILEVSTVVVTENSCGKAKDGIVALVCSNRKYLNSCKSICLLRGVRYGN